MCVNICDNNKFGSNYTRTCLDSCPYQDNTFGDETTKTCVNICPLGYFSQLSQRLCVTQC